MEIISLLFNGIFTILFYSFPFGIFSIIVPFLVIRILKVDRSFIGFIIIFFLILVNSALFAALQGWNLASYCYLSSSFDHTGCALAGINFKDFSNSFIIILVLNLLSYLFAYKIK